MDAIQITPFNFQDELIRTLSINGEPWFVANDICQALGYERARDAVSQHCRGAAKHRLPTTSGIQEMSIIPERDIYRLVMRSRLPSAERFEDWVVGTVLPSIRKTGRYEAPNQASGGSYHQIFMEGYKQGRSEARAETIETLERVRVFPIRVGRPPRTDVSRHAPTEKIVDDGTFLLPGMVEAVKGAILKFAGEETTMTAIFEHVRIPRSRTNEMGVAYLLKSNGYERIHKMTKGIRTWVYRMTEDA